MTTLAGDAPKPHLGVDDNIYERAALTAHEVFVVVARALATIRYLPPLTTP
jgi:hypothetical protein